MENKFDKLEKRFDNVDRLANEVARMSNEREMKSRNKITLLSIIIVCMAILIALGMILLYLDSRDNRKELTDLIYNAEIVEDDTGYNYSQNVGDIGDNDNINQNMDIGE